MQLRFFLIALGFLISCFESTAATTAKMSYPYSMMFANDDLKEGDYFTNYEYAACKTALFTPAYNFYNEGVITLWSTPNSALSGSYGPKIVLYYEGKFAEINLRVDDVSSIVFPAMQGVFIGFAGFNLSGSIITVGSRCNGSYETRLSRFSVVKGEENEENEVITVRSDTGDYSEAEIRFSIPDYTQYTNAYFSLEGDGVLQQFSYLKYVKDFSDNIGEGEYQLTVAGDEGEAIAFSSGDDYGLLSRIWLLPKNAKEIVLRWRLPQEESFPVWNGDCRIFIKQSDVVATPEINFEGRSDISEFPLSYDPALWYDLDGDGLLEWYFPNRGLYQFSETRKTATLVNKDFPFITSWAYFGTPGKPGAYLCGENSEIYTIDGWNAELVSEIDREIYPLDYDNDGTPDFYRKGKAWSGIPTAVFSYSGANGLSSEQLTILTPSEFYDYVVQHPSSGLGSGVSFVGDSPKESAAGAFNSYDAVDLNNDGYLDFVQGATGTYLLNLGNGSYMGDSFGGNVLFRDFDGDGLTDMLVYNKDKKTIEVILQRRDGNNVTRTLFSGLNCGSSIWCRDFDRDGDVDILVPFDAYDNSGQSYLVMFENTGKGSFKKHENYIETPTDFILCADINNDANYEVIGVYNASNSTVICYSLDGLNVKTEPKELFTADNLSGWYHGFYSERLFAGDFDNSGVTRLITSRGYHTPEYKNTNNRPQRPAAPNLYFDASKNELNVTWQAANDTETASADLTYELRIGTRPGGDDIVYAHATAGGLRRNMLPGACGYNLQQKFNTASWPQGKIYVSVQAIDGGNLGSEFSTEAVFEKNNPAATFSISMPDYPVIGDTLALTVQGMSESNSASWELGDAEIISQSDLETSISFPTPGEKQLSLTVSDGKGNLTTISKTVLIRSAVFEPANLPYDPRYAFDMDLDGNVEYYGDKFYEGDENGVYTPVKRIFNTVSNGGDAAGLYGNRVCDINRDGLPDLVLGSTDGNYTLVHMINEGDKSMRVENHTAKQHYFRPVVDLDNDGLLDICRDTSFGRNTGNYVDYTVFNPVDLNYYTFIGIADFNGDGLADILIKDNTGEGNVIVKYINNGDMTFTRSEPYESEYLSQIGSGQIGDVDSDGRPDVAWTGAWSGFGTSSYSRFAYVLPGDGQLIKVPAPSGYDFGFVAKVFDFDNNGCDDVLCEISGNDAVRGKAIIFFEQDRSYRIEVLDYSSGYGDLIFARTDGKLGFGKDIISCRPNTPPTPPQNLRVSQTSEAVVLSWDRATDKETPAAALRYNISIKRVGEEGEGAYIVSPLNDGKNGVAVPSGIILHSSTMFTIPAGNIAAGRYEAKIQAVDSQWLQGDFSETITFTVTNNSAFRMPAETMVGKIERIFISSGIDTGTIDFGEDVVLSDIVGNTAEVYWMSEGQKTLTAGELSSNIFVHPALDATFCFPETVYIGDKVRVACDNSHPDTWECATSRNTWTGEWYYASFNQPDNSKSPTFKKEGDDYAVFTFNTAMPRWHVRHTVTEPYGSAQYDADIQVQRHPEQPAIGLVDIDGASGCYRITWDIPSHLMPYVTGVKVLKETTVNGRYAQVAQLGADERQYVDELSNPSVKSARYAILFTTTYGETVQSDAHQPIHVMINAGAGTSWNLNWCKYEGRDIETYRILRGTSPDNLVHVADVSGNMSSYTDFSAPAGTLFYAVEIIADNSAAYTRSRAAQRVSRSNVVSTDDAGSVVRVETIEIISVTGDFTIDCNESKELQLLTIISPVNASIRDVDWVVKDGADIVTVDRCGRVTAIGDGTATVAAYAVDGSGIMAEATVTVKSFGSGYDIAVDTLSDNNLRLSIDGQQLNIHGIRTDIDHRSTVYIYNSNGVLLKWIETDSESVGINISNLPRGVYFVVASGKQSMGVQSGKFVR